MDEDRPLRADGSPFQKREKQNPYRPKERSADIPLLQRESFVPNNRSVAGGKLPQCETIPRHFIGVRKTSFAPGTPIKIMMNRINT